MILHRWTGLVAICLLGATTAGAQESVRFAAGAGPFKVDRLAGTPTVPSLSIHKPFGRRAIAGGRLGLIRSAGFYTLDALVIDLELGYRSRPARVEWTLAAGPWGMLGGDGDGTPYVHIGGLGTVGATWWALPRVGLTAAGSGRLWVSRQGDRATPSAMVGVVVRRRAPLTP